MLRGIRGLLLAGVGAVALGYTCQVAPPFQEDVGDLYSGATAAHATPDGGYIVSVLGGLSYGFLVKTDFAGAFEWYQGLENQEPWAMERAFDGGYVVAGDETLPDYRRVGFLLKTDARGNPSWRQRLAAGEYSAARAVVPVEDGGYVIAGQGRMPEDDLPGALLVRTDGHGYTIWQHTFGSEGTYGGASAAAVEQTADGGFVHAGTAIANGNDAYLVKTDATGNLEWQRTFGGPRRDTASCVRQTPDGGFVVSGTTVSSTDGSYEGFLLRTDASGNLLWQRTYGDAGDGAANAVAQTPDGGFVVVGYTNIGCGSWGCEAIGLLVKTDANGDVVWWHPSPPVPYPAGEGAFNSVDVTRDSGLVLAGWNSTFGTLTKTDANGNFTRRVSNAFGARDGPSSARSAPSPAPAPSRSASE